ncbi:MAG: ATP-binding protein [Nitrospiria bacterium]
MTEQVIQKEVGERRSVIRSRLFLKFFIPYISLIVTVLSLSGWFFYNSAKEGLNAELSRRLVGVANLAADAVNPNFLIRIQPGDEDTSLYRLLLKKLKKIQNATEISNLDIVDRENRFIIDLDEKQKIGDENLLLQIDTSELDRVWEGTPQSSFMYLGADGRFYKSGYAPIRDKKGRVIAVVGVEVGADFMESINEVRGQSFWITIASTGLIGMISFFLSRSMIRPIHHLVTATEQLGQESIYTKVAINRHDELGDLGNHFNHMIDQVQSKDALLKKMYRDEKTRAEELEGYSQTLLKSISSGVIGTNLKGRITACNPAAEKILGISASSLLENTVQESLGPFQALSEFIMMTVDQHVDSSRREFFIDDAVYGERWMVVTTSLLKNAGGEQIGVTAVFNDLTEVRKLQEEIKLKEQLAMLGELSAGVAHEIRNPLAAIQALVELLARKTKGAAEKELADEVVSEVGHLNKFVTDFLRFSRMPTIQLEKTDLWELLDGALAFAIPPGKYPELSVQVELPENIPPVYVDPGEFRRVLLNAFLNSIQAMKGRGELVIHAEVSDGLLLLRVCDTGPGIPLKNQKKMFQPFFTTKAGGTGLGLAISHRIISSHGGKMFFKNNEKEGTTLFIKVPINQEKEKQI